jgi:hypothetical protein
MPRPNNAPIGTWDGDKPTPEMIKAMETHGGTKGK